LSVIGPAGADAGLDFPGVENDESGHGFDDGDDTRDDAGIMAAFDDNLAVGAGGVNGELRAFDGGGGFDGEADDDFVTVGDAAEDAAGVIGEEAAVAHGIVVLAAGHAGSGKPGTNFKSFCGADAEQGEGEAGVKFAEDGIAEARGHAVDTQFDDTAEGIFCFFGSEDSGFHELGSIRIGAAHGVLFDDRGIKGACRDAADLDGAGEDGNAALGEDLAGDGAGGDAAGGFAAGGAAAAAVIADTVFFPEGEVSVAGAEDIAEGFVGGGALVFTHQDQADRRAGGFAIEDAGEDAELIAFFARGADGGLAWAAAVEFALQFIWVNGDAWG